MEEVWKQLPEELQLKLVNDHLPLQSQCRSRSVSKAWKSPRLRPGALHGLYIRKDKLQLHLYEKKAGKYHSLLRKGRFKLRFGNCVNGLFVAVLGMADKPGLAEQVFYEVFNIFSPGWRRLPLAPPAPGRACLFAGLSKMHGESPSVGKIKLEDYIYVVAMGNQFGYDVPATSLVLQVHNVGQWSCSLVELPPGHSFMYSTLSIYFKCGMLRGSEFYFLTIHSNDAEVSLCCVDVLAEHKSCKVLCGLDSNFVTNWRFSTRNHPKLAVCSGKILLVHRQDLPGGEHTFGVQLLDEEKLQWRHISSLPLEVKAQQSSPDQFYPRCVTCGGEEFVVYDGNGKGYIYNVITGAWWMTLEMLFPMSYEP